MSGKPAAFMSYVRFNDDHDDGQLTTFRERLSCEVRVQTGEEFQIFQDRAEIGWGQDWQQRIDGALDAVMLLVVIITPSLFRSTACRSEITRFLKREREQGRQDLILPVYYVTAQEMDDPELQESDELARALASRQYADWRELRFEPFTSPAVRKAIAELAVRVRDTLRQQTRTQPGRPRRGTGHPRPGPRTPRAGQAAASQKATLYWRRLRRPAWMHEGRRNSYGGDSCSGWPGEPAASSSRTERARDSCCW